MREHELHFEKYIHNRKFFSFGISHTKEKFNDWEVIALFYSCVHLIEAVLQKKCGVQTHKHDQRLEEIKNHREVFSRNCERNYSTLFNLAHTARYNVSAITDENDALHAQTYIEDIELELLDLLKSDH